MLKVPSSKYFLVIADLILPRLKLQLYLTTTDNITLAHASLLKQVLIFNRKDNKLTGFKRVREGERDKEFTPVHKNHIELSCIHLTTQQTSLNN